MPQNDELTYKDIYPIDTLRDFRDHIAYVQSYGPDNFPKDFEWLNEKTWLTLDRAYELLRKGVILLCKEKKKPELYAPLNTILDKAYQARLTSGKDTAFGILYDLEEMAFGSIE